MFFVQKKAIPKLHRTQNKYRLVFSSQFRNTIRLPRKILTQTPTDLTPSLILQIFHLFKVKRNEPERRPERRKNNVTK